jgi:hypothetical protein
VDCDPVAILAGLLGKHRVVILGENYHRPESTRFLADLAAKRLESGGCLAVALEIESGQQATLDAVMRGEEPVAAVQVHPIVDHPGYREMLARSREFIRTGKCLDVRAVDAPASDTSPRDEWMARELQALAARGPVLALLGNLHTLKRIEWESGRDDPFVAERLARHGVRVLSVLQEWEEGCKAWDSGTLLDMADPRAVTALRATMAVAAVHPPKTPGEVVDRVVVWECGSIGVARQ